VNPPGKKRAFRDPYGDWWDRQERRNFGEPVHEDDDILRVFSTEPYNHFKAPKAWFLLGCSISTFLAFCYTVTFFYPDKPSVPRTFPDGLERELGGPNAVPVRHL
jgi:NADH dehydrogenase (ubiquinone) 1 beta subcomplex subunit 8